MKNHNNNNHLTQILANTAKTEQPKDWVNPQSDNVAIPKMNKNYCHGSFLFLVVADI